MYADLKWIREVISERYPHISKEGGADLNGDSLIAGQEFIGDLNGNGAAKDNDDFRLYYENNKVLLQSQIPFLKWGNAFSSKNIIHEVLWLETKVVEPEKIKTAYEVLTTLLEETKKNLRENRDLIPEKKIKGVYNIMYEKLGLKSEITDLLSEGLAEKQIDCDTSSLAVMAVAEEMNWPVTGHAVPDHFFIEWKDGQTQFYADQGDLHRKAKEYYSCNLCKLPEKIDVGHDLAPLSRDQLVANISWTRSGIYNDRENHKAAIDLADEAIALAPEMIMPHVVKGSALINVDDLKAAQREIDIAVKLAEENSSPESDDLPLNSYLADAYLARGHIYREMGRSEDALEDFNTVIDGSFPSLPLLGGCGNMTMGAIESLDDSRNRAKAQRALTNHLDGKYASALEDVKILEDSEWLKVYRIAPNEYSFELGYRLATSDFDLSDTISTGQTWYLAGSDHIWVGAHLNQRVAFDPNYLDASATAGVEVAARFFEAAGMTLKIRSTAGFNLRILGKTNPDFLGNSFVLENGASLTFRMSNSIYYGVGATVQSDPKFKEMNVMPFINLQLIGF